MSDKQLYISCWFPSEQIVEENGARRVAYSFYAANEKQARAKAILHFIEQYPDANDADFALKIYNHAEGIPCPAPEVWDENFLYEHDWDEDQGHPVQKVHPRPVDFYKLSSHLRVAVLVKYHTPEITSDQLAGAVELQHPSSSFDSHIADAISKTPAVAAMYPERILESIDYIRENCAPTKKWPEIKAVLANWLKQREQDSKEEAGRTESISTSKVVPRSYEHTYKTLDLEIATALWAGDVDPNAPLPSITRWANGIIQEEREDWKRWSMQLRTQPNILKYDRPTIFGVVRNVPSPETYKFPESHGRYIAEYLAEHGNMENSSDETEQNAASATGPLEPESPETTTVAPQHSDDVSATGTVETAQHVERTGPFYYRTADGQPGRANKLAKLEAVIEQGCIEITKEEYQALKEAPPVQQQTSSDQPGINNLGNGRFSIEGLAPEQPQTNDKSASNEVEKTEVAATQPPVTTFQSIGAALEHDLAEKGDNMKIWRSVMRTDPRYTKDLAGAGFEGTSINAEYMIMRATEIFGPIGTGWGFEVLEDRMLPGAPMSEAIYEDKKFIGNRLLRDGDGTLITEQNHSIKIAFWYLKDNGVVERFEAYGATKYLYKTKHGITCDGEAQKKSLTDAIKKALSLLGFSADVWLGLYDQAEYKQENATEFAIKNASDKAEDVSRLRNELDEKLTRVANTIENAVSPNEAKKVFDTLAREVEVHRKAAEAKGDSEHSKYLSGRLRRLSQIKDQRINTLTENQDQSA